MFYAFIIDLVEEWRPIVDGCKAEVVQNTSMVTTLLAQYLMKEFPELRQTIQRIAYGIIETATDDISSKLEALIAREQDPFTTQDVLLEVVNGIRFRTFENVLRQILDTTDLKLIGDHENNIREEIRKRLGLIYVFSSFTTFYG